jgi:hypothetical protein
VRKFFMVESKLLYNRIPRSSRLATKVYALFSACVSVLKQISSTAILRLPPFYSMTSP